MIEIEQGYLIHGPSIPESGWTLCYYLRVVSEWGLMSSGPRLLSELAIASVNLNDLNLSLDTMDRLEFIFLAIWLKSSI